MPGLGEYWQENDPEGHLLRGSGEAYVPPAEPHFSTSVLVSDLKSIFFLSTLTYCILLTYQPGILSETELYFFVCQGM